MFRYTPREYRALKELKAFGAALKSEQEAPRVARIAQEAADRLAPDNEDRPIGDLK
jgi:hypothetical protein